MTRIRTGMYATYPERPRVRRLHPQFTSGAWVVLTVPALMLLFLPDPELLPGGRSRT